MSMSAKKRLIKSSNVNVSYKLCWDTNDANYIFGTYANLLYSVPGLVLRLLSCSFKLKMCIICQTKRKMQKYYSICKIIKTHS